MVGEGAVLRQRETSSLPDRLGGKRGHPNAFSPLPHSSARYPLDSNPSESSAENLVVIAATRLRLDKLVSNMFRNIVLICILTCSLWFWAVEAQLAPITEFKRGYAGRVDYVKAVISKQHLDTGTRPSDIALIFFRKLVDNGKNDVAGQLVPRRLGGTGVETYNIAPMNDRTQKIFYKKKVEDPVYEAVSGGNEVVLEVWPRYEGKEATRPNRFDVSASRADGTAVVDKTTIPNPTS